MGTDTERLFCSHLVGGVWGGGGSSGELPEEILSKETLLEQRGTHREEGEEEKKGRAAN